MSSSDDIKKIDPKKHKKHAQFLLYSYCHYILEIYNRLADKPDINFSILIPLVNNYILNLFIICLANQINLDITKGIIDEAIIIVLDYISISHEEEFQKQNYNPRINDAIHFSWQKIHGRLLKLIPNSPLPGIITNMPSETPLCMSPKSLPSSLGNSKSPIALSSSNNNTIHIQSINKSKKKPPTSWKISNLINYISIIGSSHNRTTKAIIFTCEIITQIFNLFAVVYPIKLSNININTNTNTNTNNWLELFEPINIHILTDDTHEDDVQYSNNVFFTRLTYNLDIVECYVNMLIPQLLKISQYVISNSNYDIIIGQKIAMNINQIYLRLINHYGINIPGFIYLTIIYNYLHSHLDVFADDTNSLFIINRCCMNGVNLGLYLLTNYQYQLANSDANTVFGKYSYAFQKLKLALGNNYNKSDKINNSQKIINNKNLITAIITLNSHIND